MTSKRQEARFLVDRQAAKERAKVFVRSKLVQMEPSTYAKPGHVHVGEQRLLKMSSS